MDQVWATVISGIGSALIAGSIGAFSALLSYRAARHQREGQLVDNQRNRNLQLAIGLVQKRREALETIWSLLFAMERDGKLSKVDLTSFVKSLMWMPADIRASCLQVLKSNEEGGAESIVAHRQRMADVREDLVRYASSTNLEETPK